MKQYHYQVCCSMGAQYGVYTGTINANSEQEVIAFIKRKYMNVVDYQIW